VCLHRTVLQLAAKSLVDAEPCQDVATVHPALPLCILRLHEIRSEGVYPGEGHAEPYTHAPDTHVEQ
jgi:hypothetical protein